LDLKDFDSQTVNEKLELLTVMERMTPQLKKV